MTDPRQPSGAFPGPTETPPQVSQVPPNRPTATQGEKPPVVPEVWDVLTVVRVTDGDSVRVVRRRDVRFDGRDYLLTDNSLGGVPLRLVWVDTPERGQPGWADARADLSTWLHSRRYIRAHCYEAAGWDRILADLIDGETGESASQWMMTAQGWPPYTPR